MAVRRNAAVPNPPRQTGDQTADLMALISWANDFYRAAVIESGLLDPSFQGTPDNFSADNLPDPQASSIANAQNTANEAYRLAAATRTIADSVEERAYLLVTAFTLVDADNQSTLTFAAPLDSASYLPIVQAVGYTGTPAVDAFVVTTITRSTTAFVVTLAAAPGAGNSVSFEVVVFPK